MALDLQARKVVVEGLDPEETPTISPVNKSRWNGGDNLSTSKLGLMLSSIQNRLGDLDVEQNESPTTTVEGNEATITENINSATLQPVKSSNPSAIKPNINTSSNRPSLGGSKPVASSRPSLLAKSNSLSSSTPIKKSTLERSASPASNNNSVRIVGRPSLTSAGKLSATPGSKKPSTPSAAKPSIIKSVPISTTPKSQPTTISTSMSARELIRRSVSGNMSSLKATPEKLPAQTIGRKSISTSAGLSSVTKNAPNQSGTTASAAIRKKIAEVSDNESVMSSFSRSTVNSKVISRSVTPNKTSGGQRSSFHTPTTTKTPITNKMTPSPRGSASVSSHNLNNSFSESSTSTTNRRTPVKAQTPKFGYSDNSSKSLTRKTSFGSVGSSISASPSVSSVMSSASKTRRSLGTGIPQSTHAIKHQKSADELDEIYSTNNVVSSLKAQKIPSAQLLRTTIQRIDTASMPHTLNPLRKHAASPFTNNSNNNSFSNLSRRNSRSGNDEMLEQRRPSFNYNHNENSAASKLEINDNFGMDIKTVDVDDEMENGEGEDERFASPPNSRNSSLQDLKPLGKPSSSNSLLGVKPSPLTSSRPGPFTHRKSYMMPQTPDLENARELSQVDDDGEDLLSMFVRSADPHDQYPSPPAPLLSSRSKSTSFKFQNSPRRVVFPPPYPIKTLFPTDAVEKSDKSPYMPPLMHSTPSAINAIYRAAVAKEASTSQTMLGRIASFRK